MAGDGLDEATRERMRQREEYLKWPMTQLLQETEQMEQRNQEQGGFACGDLLLAALQQWQVGAVAALLVMLFGLCWWLRKRSHQPDSSDQEESSSSDQEESSSSDQGESSSSDQEESSSSDEDESSSSDEDESSSSDQEESSSSDQGESSSSDEDESSSSRTEQEEEESEAEDSEEETCLIRNFTKRVERAVRSEASRSRVVEELVGNLLGVFQKLLSNSFFPVLQPAIGVGSSFEGWSPCGHDAVYHLLVPLKPPRGHIFHLDRSTAGHRPAKHACVLVGLECTCRRDQGVENMLYFLHHREEELRRNQGPSLLDTLCSGSYLDVQKTAQWFQDLVSSAWGEIPQSRRYSMEVLPSSRSCKLQLKNASEGSLIIEMMFGVQQGDSDIFLSSQAPEDTFNPSTMWPESYAVAEVKFFRHIARQAPDDTFHLKCLQLCAGILLGTGFSTDTLKTVVMHILNTIPVSSWSRSEVLMRLRDIMEYLHECLQEDRLDHFFFGNENMPEEIILPAAFQTAEPFNLFQREEEEPDAYAKAVGEYSELQDRLTRLLYF
ncbi:inositol 1,4,5-trisphosphate receptor-interacting protein-like 1 [Alca torda]